MVPSFAFWDGGMFEQERLESLDLWGLDFPLLEGQEELGEVVDKMLSLRQIALDGVLKKTR